ncbi:MAG: hypothetical protein ACLQHF_07460 [Terracidiphilus sp.]
MAAKNNCFGPISRRLLVGALGMCVLLALAALAGSRSGAQSAPPQQAPPAPAQAASPAPVQPATQSATAAAPTPPRPPYPGMPPGEMRKQQVAQECADLLKLATDLKAQVDKTRKDELSVTVVRKAAELEQMAHKVRSGAALSTSNE